MRQPYRDRSSIVDGIPRSPGESLQGSESSRWPPQAACLTRRKTWVGAAQPGCAFCLHPPKSSPPRLTDGHALLCAAAERCLALRSAPEERVDLDQNRQTGRACAKHPKQKGAHRQPSRSVEPVPHRCPSIPCRTGACRAEPVQSKWLPGITHVGPSSSVTSINR